MPPAIGCGWRTKVLDMFATLDPERCGATARQGHSHGDIAGAKTPLVAGERACAHGALCVCRSCPSSRQP